MVRPHEALGLPQPLGRKLPRGLVAWNLAIAAFTVVCSVIYVIEVNAAASKGYDLSKAERRVEGLNIDAMALQNKAASMSSIQQLTGKASELGFVAVDKVEFVNPAQKNYALAR